MNNKIAKTTKDINATLATEGWIVIKKFFEDERARLNDLNLIDSSLPANECKIAVEANKIAYKLISSIMEQIKGLAQIEAKKKIKYE